MGRSSWNYQNWRSLERNNKKTGVFLLHRPCREMTSCFRGGQMFTFEIFLEGTSMALANPILGFSVTVWCERCLSIIWQLPVPPDFCLCGALTGLPPPGSFSPESLPLGQDACYNSLRSCTCCRFHSWSPGFMYLWPEEIQSLSLQVHSVATGMLGFLKWNLQCVPCVFYLPGTHSKRSEWCPRSPCPWAEHEGEVPPAPSLRWVFVLLTVGFVPTPKEIFINSSQISTLLSLLCSRSEWRSPRFVWFVIFFEICISWVCLTLLPLASDICHSSGPRSKLLI